jgi:hypothetical protein
MARSSGTFRADRFPAITPHGHFYGYRPCGWVHYDIDMKITPLGLLIAIAAVIAIALALILPWAWW